MKLLLTHVPQARTQYYGARALAQLQALVDVVLHEGAAPLDPQGVMAAAKDADLIIADRSTPMPAGVFAGLPKLKVVMRSAVDIRNIDVAAASKAGVLVTHAEAGFVPSVVELAVDVNEPDELNESGMLPLVKPPFICEFEPPTVVCETVSVPLLVVLAPGDELELTLLNELLAYLSVDP